MKRKKYQETGSTPDAEATARVGGLFSVAALSYEGGPTVWLSLYDEMNVGGRERSISGVRARARKAGRQFPTLSVILAIIVALWLGMGIDGNAQSYSWSNFVGTPGGAGNSDGIGAIAQFNNPTSVVVDGSGNVYVADY